MFLFRIISIALFCVYSAFTVFGQSAVYPLQVTTTITPPYTTNVSDYIGNSALRTQVFITLNDLNEPTWDTRLRITVTGNGFKIFTRPDFIPPTPLVIYRDAPNILSGEELADFFNANNTVAEGINKSQIFTNNKFPEGYYTFCVEVLDYKTGKVLSNNSCSFLSMQLPNVPITLTPRCDEVVAYQNIQQIFFSWSPVQSYSGLQTTDLSYQLTLYEINNPTTAPAYAIQNGLAQLIYTSPWQKHTTLLYSINEPPLTLGKRYVYRIQSKFDTEDIELKNNGYSEVCSFYYGYPEGGTISINSPLSNTTYLPGQPPLFSWNAPSNVLNGQSVSYLIQMKVIENGQTPADAAFSNDTYFTQTFNSILPTGRFDYTLPIRPEANTNYVWWIESYTGNQLTAVSPYYVLNGPPLLNGFYANRHYITVTETTTSDIHDLSGKGSITLANGVTESFNFQHIYLKLVAGNWVLESGEITHELKDTSVITLQPNLRENNLAYFHPRKINIYKDGLKIYGFCSWDFPHATIASVLPKVRSTSQWVDYNLLKVIGDFTFAENQSYTLLNPFQYEVHFANYSSFSVSENEYRLFMHGDLYCSNKIYSASETHRIVKLPFKDATQLYYFGNGGITPVMDLQAITNFKLQLNPQEYWFDFSTLQSPLKLSENPDWMGVYFIRSNIIFQPSIDVLGQLSFVQKTTIPFQPTPTDSSIAYIDSRGHTFQYKYTFQGFNTKFNTFPSSITEFNIDITANVLNPSGLKGKMKIPFISEDTYYHFYAPFNSSGLYSGYLTDIENVTFTYQPNKLTEKLNFKITSAVFENLERLAITMDMDWPYASINTVGLTGFKAWGDYHIGFYQKNGSRLLESTLSGNIADYPFDVTTIGAGRGAGYYAFGFSGTVRINDDVSGSNGAPMVNTYSLQPNRLIPVEADISSYNISSSTSSGTANDWSSLSEEQQEEIIKNRLQLEIHNSTQAVQQNINPNGLASLYQNGNTILINLDTISSNTITVEPSYRGIRGKLNDKEFEIVQDFTTELINLAVESLTKPLRKFSDTLNDKISNRLDSTLLSVKPAIKKVIDSVMYDLVGLVIRNVSAEQSILRESIGIIADTISTELTNEVYNSLVASVNDNIKVPTQHLIRAIIYDSTTAYLKNAFIPVVDSLLYGNYKAENIIEPIFKGAPERLIESGNEVLNYFHPHRIAEVLYNTAMQTISGIDLGRVASRLTGGIIQQGQAVIANTVSRMASQQANMLVSQAFSSTPGLNAIAPPAVKMDFNNIGQKISSGRIDQIITVDPTNIAVNTKFVSFNGQLKPVKDSIYGKAWRGAFDVTIHKPKPFSIAAAFISGKKDSHEFWFCQISSGGSDSTMGGALSKEVKAFNNPVSIGPVELVGGKGRVYKGMREIGRGTDIIPDEAMAYGAYLNLVLYDSKNKGKNLRIQVETEYTIDNDHNYIIELNGNIQGLSQAVSINTPDPNAVFRGTLKLYYNSSEDHFLGSADVAIEKPGTVCGHGFLLVETKPGVWKVHFGERENPNRFIPACNTFGVMGWVMVDQVEAEIGGGVGYYMNARAGIDIGVLKAGIGVDAGVEAMAWVVFQHSPRFRFDQLGVQARAWINIYVYYETKIKSGEFTLLDIEVGIAGIATINPKPANLYGQAWGDIKILAWEIGFNADFRLNL